MKRIFPLILSSAAFILAFPPALKAQEVDIGPGGITVHRQHRYSRDDWERERERQRELWRERFYERHGYYPDESGY
ncbi:MAG TPA: hypothetical protein VE860_24350 [Chthoniobacterales bacterium]|jgi:hypothetical protein|nr:hypothetical protein [Chthoniobacterales bacterium]